MSVDFLGRRDENRGWRIDEIRVLLVRSILNEMSVLLPRAFCESLCIHFCYLMLKILSQLSACKYSKNIATYLGIVSRQVVRSERVRAREISSRSNDQHALLYVLNENNRRRVETSSGIVRSSLSYALINDACYHVNKRSWRAEPVN